MVSEKGVQKKFRAFGPKIRGVQKLPKISFFGLKNVKILESGFQKFLAQKFVIAPMRSKMHFALKSILSMEKRKLFKNNNYKISQISESLQIFF